MSSNRWNMLKSTRSDTDLSSGLNNVRGAPYFQRGSISNAKPNYSGLNSGLQQQIGLQQQSGLQHSASHAGLQQGGSQNRGSDLQNAASGLQHTNPLHPCNFGARGTPHHIQASSSSGTAGSGGGQNDPHGKAINLEQFEYERTLVCLNMRVTTLTFCGEWLAVGNGSGDVKIYDTVSWAERHTLKGSVGIPPKCLVITSRQIPVVTTSPSRGTRSAGETNTEMRRIIDHLVVLQSDVIRVFAVKDEFPLVKKLTPPMLNGDQQSGDWECLAFHERSCVAVSSNSKDNIVVACTTTALVVYSTIDWGGSKGVPRIVRTIESWGHPKVAIFNPAGNRFIVGHGSGSICVWNAKENFSVETLLSGHSASITSLQFYQDIIQEEIHDYEVVDGSGGANTDGNSTNPNGKSIVGTNVTSGSSGIGNRWKHAANMILENKNVSKITAPTKTVKYRDILRTVLLSTSHDTTIRLWQAPFEADRDVKDKGNERTRGESELDAWTLMTKLSWTNGGHDAGVRTANIANDNRWCVSGAKDLIVWKINVVRAPVFEKRHSSLYLKRWDHNIYLEPFQSLKITGMDYINVSVFSPNDNRIIVGSADGVLGVYVRKKQLVLEECQHTGNYERMRSTLNKLMLEDGRIILSNGEEKHTGPSVGARKVAHPDVSLVMECLENEIRRQDSGLRDSNSAGISLNPVQDQNTFCKRAWLAAGTLGSYLAANPKVSPREGFRQFALQSHDGLPQFLKDHLIARRLQDTIEATRRMGMGMLRRLGAENDLDLEGDFYALSKNGHGKKRSGSYLWHPGGSKWTSSTPNLLNAEEMKPKTDFFTEDGTMLSNEKIEALVMAQQSGQQIRSEKNKFQNSSVNVSRVRNLLNGEDGDVSLSSMSESSLKERFLHVSSLSTNTINKMCSAGELPIEFKNIYLKALLLFENGVLGDPGLKQETYYLPKLMAGSRMLRKVTKNGTKLNGGSDAGRTTGNSGVNGPNNGSNQGVLNNGCANQGGGDQHRTVAFHDDDLDTGSSIISVQPVIKQGSFLNDSDDNFCTEEENLKFDPLQMFSLKRSVTSGNLTNVDSKNSTVTPLKSTTPLNSARKRQDDRSAVVKYQTPMANRDSLNSTNGGSVQPIVSTGNMMLQSVRTSASKTGLKSESDLRSDLIQNEATSMAKPRTGGMMNSNRGNISSVDLNNRANANRSDGNRGGTSRAVADDTDTLGPTSRNLFADFNTTPMKNRQESTVPSSTNPSTSATPATSRRESVEGNSIVPETRPVSLLRVRQLSQKDLTPPLATTSAPGATPTDTNPAISQKGSVLQTANSIANSQMQNSHSMQTGNVHSSSQIMQSVNSHIQNANSNMQNGNANGRPVTPGISVIQSVRPITPGMSSTQRPITPGMSSVGRPITPGISSIQSTRPLHSFTPAGMVRELRRTRSMSGTQGVANLQNASRVQADTSAWENNQNQNHESMQKKPSFYRSKSSSSNSIDPPGGASQNQHSFKQQSFAPHNQHSFEIPRSSNVSAANPNGPFPSTSSHVGLLPSLTANASMGSLHCNGSLPDQQNKPSTSLMWSNSTLGKGVTSSSNYSCGEASATAKKTKLISLCVGDEMINLR